MFPVVFADTVGRRACWSRWCFQTDQGRDAVRFGLRNSFDAGADVHDLGLEATIKWKTAAAEITRGCARTRIKCTFVRTNLDVAVCCTVLLNDRNIAKRVTAEQGFVVEETNRVEG